MRSRETLYRATIGGLALVVVVGGWFLGSKTLELDAKVAEMEETLLVLEQDLGEAASNANFARGRLSVLQDDFADLTSGLASSNVSLGSRLDQLDSGMTDLESALNFLQSDIEASLVGLGRCIYHEAEFHEYTYWYLDDPVEGRYITHCD